MQREIRLAEKLLLAGYAVILHFMIVQDWVPLGPLNNIEAITSIQSPSDIATATIIGVAQVLLLMAGIIYYSGKRYPIWAKLWFIIHPSCIFIGVLVAWWVPYFFGIGADARVERYEIMFGNTHAFLPVMNGIVPNTLHTVFHFMLFACIVLSFYLCITKPKTKKGI